MKDPVFSGRDVAEAVRTAAYEIIKRKEERHPFGAK